MNPITLQVCHTFLQPFPDAFKGALLALLPKAAQERLSELPPPGPFQKKWLHEDFLDQVHPSWLAPYLRTLSQHTVPLFLASLQPWQKEGIQALLGHRNHAPSLQPCTRKYVRTVLRSFLAQNQTLLPPSCLPESSLNPLLLISKEKLSKLLTYLGLHDLSLEMRQIISTSMMKTIFLALSKDEGAYLHRLFLYQEPLVFERLFLNRWDGSQESMHKLLIQRGIDRLAHALYFADPSLVWYICRRLDMHLATLLLKQKEKPSHPRAKEFLDRQIDQILSLLTPSPESL